MSAVRMSSTRGIFDTEAQGEKTPPNCDAACFEVGGLDHLIEVEDGGPTTEGPFGFKVALICHRRGLVSLRRP